MIKLKNYDKLRFKSKKILYLIIMVLIKLVNKIV